MLCLIQTIMKFITTWDDGRLDDKKLLPLLRKYKIPAIFYIPTITELSDDEIKDIAKDFEIGGHTVSHFPDYKFIPSPVIESEIGDNRKWLQELTGQEVNSFCYPRGKYDERVIEAVKGAGFHEARTTDVFNIKEPKDIFRIATSVHVHPWRKEYAGRPWNEIALELYQKAKADNGYFHLWGHSWEIDKYKQWDELESLFQTINYGQLKWTR